MLLWQPQATARITYQQTVESEGLERVGPWLGVSSLTGTILTPWRSRKYLSAKQLTYFRVQFTHQKWKRLRWRESAAIICNYKYMQKIPKNRHCTRVKKRFSSTLRGGAQTTYFQRITKFLFYMGDRRGGRCSPCARSAPWAQGAQLAALLVIAPKPIHLAHIASGDEGLDVVRADEVHQVGELIFGQQALDLHSLLPGITASDLIEAASAHDFGDNIFPDLFVVLADDADPFAAVQTRHKVVYYQAIEPSTQDADDHQTEGIDKEGRAADYHPRDGHRQTEIEMQILIHYLRQDIQPARGCVDTKQNRLRGAEYQHEAQQIKPHVSHHGSATLSEQLLVGADLLPKLHKRSQHQRCIGRLHPELLAYQQVSQHEQDCIDHQHHSRHLHVHTGVFKDSANHNGQSRDTAHHQLARHQKIVHGRSGNHHRNGDNQNLLPEFQGAKLRPDRRIIIIHYRLLVESQTNTQSQPEPRSNPYPTPTKQLSILPIAPLSIRLSP